MLRDLKDTAVNVVSTTVVVGVSAACLVGLGLILAREAIRTRQAKRKFWKASKWPERVRSTLLGGSPPDGDDHDVDS